MNGRKTQGTSGRGGDGQRSWPRLAVAPVTLALVCLLAAACGGGSSPSAVKTTATGGSDPSDGGSDSSGGGAGRQQAALVYAKCMRSHGVKDFPDPDSSGNFNVSSEPTSSQEADANQACNRLLDVGTQLSTAQTQRTLANLLKYSQCMRAHGVPNFPDPQATTGGVGVPGGFTFDTAGRNLNQKGAVYQAAAKTCEPLAKHAKG
jgi:hypothetical protein